MIIKEYLFHFIEKYCYGIENAIIRKRLLGYMKNWDSEITDRELRREIEAILEICSCERGYFYPKNKEEIDYSIEYLKKKIFPLWKKIHNKKMAYSQFYPDYDEKQGELF